MIDDEFEAITPYIINFIEAEDDLDARLERLDKLRRYISQYVPGEYDRPSPAMKVQQERLDS